MLPSLLLIHTLISLLNQGVGVKIKQKSNYLGFSQILPFVSCNKGVVTICFPQEDIGLQGHNYLSLSSTLQDFYTGNPVTKVALSKGKKYISIVIVISTDQEFSS